MHPDDTNTPFEYKPEEKAANLEAAPSANDEEPAEAVVPRPRDSESVRWSAPEYIEHNHGGGWYFTLTLATAALAAGAFFITGRDYFTAIIIAILGIIVGVSAGRKPRVINYELTSKGIRAGEKDYAYSLFKSFSLIREESPSSISLTPTKRFMPPLSIYLESQDEETVVDALSRHLPYTEKQLDAVDRLSRRLRF